MLPDPYVQEPGMKKLFLVKQNGKYGYINKSGGIVVGPRFDKASNDFFEGLAPVAINRQYGYIDESGNIAIDLQFDLTTNFSEGLAYVWAGGKYGYIDRTGTIVIAPQFDGAGKFSEGLAPVNVGGKNGFINRAGELMLGPRPSSSARKLYDGLAVIKIGNKFGYVDERDRIVIEPRFDVADNFSEGLAHVNIGGECVHIEIGRQGGEHFYIDKIGKIIIDANRCGISQRIDIATNFSEGMARVAFVEMVTPRNLSRSFISSLFSNFSEDTSQSAKVVKLKYGYINREGKIAIKPQFDNAEDFQGGLARVNIGYIPASYWSEVNIYSEGKWGYIDKSGDYVWKPSD